MYKVITVNFLCWLASSTYAQSNTTSQSVDVTHVVIDLNFDWNKSQAFGKTIISLTTTKPTEVIHLDAEQMVIQSVVLHNNHLKFKYTENNSGIDILFDDPVGENQKIELTIKYHTQYVNEYDPTQPGGSFGKGLRFFRPTKSNPIKRQQIWSQGEPDGNKFWFPCINSLDDLRTTEFIATVPDGHTVISNGNLVTQNKNIDGSTTFHYKTDIPYPNYLTAFVVGEYTELTQEVGDITLRTYCYPDEKIAALATTERLPDMVKFLTDKTGLAYPFKNYAQVMVQNYPFPSLTGQSMFSIISDNMIDDYGTHADFLYLWDGVEFNALASQWFGNVITPQHWRDIWLTKSFAQYFEGLYTDYKNGHEEYLLWYHPFESGSVFGDWDAGNRHAIVTDNYSTLDQFTSDSYAKYRGALVLRMLRKELGDPQFFSVIKHFVATHAFKPVSTRDFQNSIKVVSGRDMQWFFDQWIYQTGHPVFEIKKRYDANAKRLNLTVNQVQAADTITGSVRYFQGKVVVEIDDRLEEIFLEAKQENHFTFNSAVPPGLVAFDYENTWIREVKFERTFEELLHQFQNDRDMLGRQSAMMELVGIAKDTSSSIDVKKKIHEAFFNVIDSKLYWRLRANSINQWRTILPLPYSQKTTDLLVKIIREERSWLRAAAVGMLGMTTEKKYDKLYISLLSDTSDRVINVAAIALGKTKSPSAFDALKKLPERPSWKSQSLMSSLNGLAQLGDPKVIEIAVAALADIQSPRWFLSNGWDYPLVAAQALASLGAGHKAYPLLFERIKTASQEEQKDDVFDLLLLITTLADPRAQEVFELLKQKYRNDLNAMTAISNYEEVFKTSIQK